MLTAEQALSITARLYERLVDRRKLVEKRFKYLDGEHPLVYASDSWKKFHGERYKGFRDNWCDVVAQAPVDRLRVEGIRLGEAGDITTADEKEIWGDWSRNEMTAQSLQGFLTSVAASRSAVIVWDDGRNESIPLDTWERPDQVAIDYDPTGRFRRHAIKAWTEDNTEYATLYTPEALFKWERPTAIGEDTRKRLMDQGFQIPGTLGWGGGWKPREIADEPWPLPNPLGVVPVVEIMNRPRIGMNPISEIDGVIAMQDAINAMWSYLFANADQASMEARIVLGAEPPSVPILDENGQVIGSKPANMEDLASGRLLFLPNATGVDQYSAAKAEYFISTIKQALAHISAQTRTPGHYLNTNDSMANLNGDALTAAEVPLATKCGTFQIHAGPSIKEIAALNALVRGRQGIADAIRATDSIRFVQWRDAAMHSLAQVADAATKDKSIGMSLRTILEKRYGMTEPEIDREMERIAAERPPDPVGEALVGELRNGSNGNPAAGGQ